MNRDETNGMLRALEAQFLALEAAMDAIYKTGVLTDDADERLLSCRVDLINLSSRIPEIRGWNTEVKKKQP